MSKLVAALGVLAIGLVILFGPIPRFPPARAGC
jgi:hypothetical protein